jgi:hypothetical protein
MDVRQPRLLNSKNLSFGDYESTDFFLLPLHCRLQLIVSNNNPEIGVENQNASPAGVKIVYLKRGRQFCSLYIWYMLRTMSMRYECVNGVSHP